MMIKLTSILTSIAILVAGEFLSTCKVYASNEISDGIYIIKSAIGKNKAVDVRNGGKNNHQNISLYDINRTDAQKFYIHKTQDGYYEMRAVCSGKMVSVEGEGCGANVCQLQRNRSDSQKWKFNRLSGEYLTITSKSHGLNLDVSGGQSENFTNIQVWTPNGTDAQKFILKPIKKFNTKNYTVSDDKSKLQIDRIEGLFKSAEMTQYKSKNQIKSVIENSSICLGAYDKSGKQVGFMRVLTDYELNCLILNVVVDVNHRGNGIGTMLIRTILENPKLKKCTFSLIPSSNKVAMGYKLLGFDFTGFNYMTASSL